MANKKEEKLPEKIQILFDQYKKAYIDYYISGNYSEVKLAETRLYAEGYRTIANGGRYRPSFACYKGRVNIEKQKEILKNLEFAKNLNQPEYFI